MENIQVTLTQDQIQKAVNDAIVESLKSSYSNPVKKAVELALAEQQNAINECVKEVISSSLNDPKFKEELGKAVIQQMISATLTKR